jgi:mannose-1-phosphate guanylyltransferase/mannose-6-phosphate isomerase
VVELVDTRDTLVYGNEMLTAVVGVSDAIIVTTDDAVLVATKDNAHRVKALVDDLRRRNRPEANEHLRMYRPWGWYQRVDRGPRFQVKRIMVKPGGTLSLQKHLHRAEHWVVVHGTAEVTVDDTKGLVKENESIYVPLGAVHRLHNPGKINLELIEVQVGSYTGEDDIIRLEDAYSR